MARELKHNRDIREKSRIVQLAGKVLVKFCAKFENLQKMNFASKTSGLTSWSAQNFATRKLCAMKDLSKRLIALRAGSSRREFARKLGITESTLRNYEKGASIPDAQFLADICKKLQISPEWLLLGSGAMHATESVPEQTATFGESLQGECQRCSKLERGLDVEKKKNAAS